MQKDIGGMKCEKWVGVSDVQNGKLASKQFDRSQAVRNKALLTSGNLPQGGSSSP